MKDTKRIDDEINQLQNNIQRMNVKINRLKGLKLEWCIDCKDSKCRHAGATTDAVCQSHTLYGVD